MIETRHRVALTLLSWTALALMASPSAAAPPAATEIVKPVAPQEEQDSDTIGFDAFALFGASRVTEAHTPTHGSADIAAGFTFALPYGLHAGAGFQGRFYEHTYISSNPSLSMDGAERVPQTERFLDVRVLVGIDVLSFVTDIASINVDVAPRFGTFLNDAFVAHRWSVQLGLNSAIHLSDRFHLRGGSAWSRAFAGTEETLSAMGVPRDFWDFDAGMGIDFPGCRGNSTWSVRLSWVATLVVFDHSARFYNGAVTGLGFSL